MSIFGDLDMAKKNYSICPSGPIQYNTLDFDEVQE